MGTRRGVSKARGGGFVPAPYDFGSWTPHTHRQQRERTFQPGTTFLCLLIPSFLISETHPSATVLYHHSFSSTETAHFTPSHNSISYQSFIHHTSLVKIKPSILEMKAMLFLSLSGLVLCTPYPTNTVHTPAIGLWWLPNAAQTKLAPRADSSAYALSFCENLKWH